MTPEEIRNTATRLQDAALDPAGFRSLMFNLAAEAVAQLATIACQQCEVIDAIDALTFKQAAIRELMERSADPMHQAAQQVAIMSGIPEVLALWNREHPLQRMEMQRTNKPARAMGPMGDYSAVKR